MEKIKAIFIDLDGTLLNTEKKISELNKKVIKKLIEKGISVHIATGRSYYSMKSYKDELGLDTEIICYNGAKIIDGLTEETINEILLKEDVSKKIIEIGRKNNIHMNVFQNEKLYVENENEIIQNYKITSSINYNIKNFNTFNNYEFLKIMFIDENSILKKVEKEIRAVLSNEVYLAYSRSTYLEILDKNVSKGGAVGVVIDRRKLKKEETMAIGDAENDIEMLDIVGTPVCMGNADENIKNRYKNIAPSNDESGLGVFLNEYFKLNL
ncbi:MAG: HAD family phosphatase [Fusobacteria bacterium]|nr:HAD family phosphatase [Fusobacteriota bacterium]